MTAPSRQLAKDVASELERRRRRRKVMTFTALIGAIIAAIFYLRCGSGWGTGGKGAGSGEGKGPGSGGVTQPDEGGTKRCTIRVSSEGIVVDGKQMTRDDAVAACKKTEGALVTITGDARQGDWDELRTSLEGAGVKVFTRGN